jgi:pilus assembly protein CpaB
MSGPVGATVKNPRAFIFALIITVVATFAQCRYVAEREKKLLYDSQPIKTLLAVKDIPANFKLDETMVEQVDVPRKWRQPRALSEVEEVLGQISADPIIAGEQIVSTKLLQAADAGLAYFVQKKHRAISIAVDEVTAVGGHLKPGNYVDILGTFDFGQGEKSDMRTVTLFQNVRVLSVGDDIGQPTAARIHTSRDLKNREGKDLSPEQISARFEAERGTASQIINQGKTVSIEVTPSEAQKVLLAQELGTLSLSLRSLWESERFVELEHSTIQSTLGVPQQVRYKPKPGYRLIQSGGF